MSVKWYGKEVLNELELANKRALTAAALFVQGDAILRCPRKNGRLRQSIKYKVKGDDAIIGTNVEYACILGGNTLVKCKNGNKIISKVKSGDLVLTQTGEYHKVLARIEHRAKDFPNMIEIICKYRKDRNHTLKTTENHKFLVYREGRNKWIEAKNLLITDKLYSLKKIPYNKNTGYYINCLNCNKRFKPQDTKLLHKYCSMKCRDEYHRINGNPNIGSKRTIETKLKQSNQRKEFHKLHPEKHVNRILNKKGFQTDIEKKIEQWLIDRKVKFEKQKRIGIIYADFYLPETNEIIEGDGAFWHSNQNKDIKRDLYIKEIDPNIKITHLHFYDKRFSKNINPNPIDNVYYEICNSDVNSFVDMEKFEFKDIVSIKPFLYKKGKKNDAMQAKIYDLSIDKVHSYYANGILVSNSYVEFGTGIYAESDGRQTPWVYFDEKEKKFFRTRGRRPKPFLRPAIDENKQEIKDIFIREFKKI